MALKIGRPSEPRVDGSPSAATAAFMRSQALDILESELLRYCGAEIQGQSFLIAGHRGAGKTTMVLRAIETAFAAADVGSAVMRPLPVLLHGPSLFHTLPSDAETAAQRSPAPAPSSATDAKSLLTAVLASSDGGAPKPAAAPAGAATPPATPTTQGGPSKAVELQAQVALTQIVLALHRSACRAFSARYRRRILSMADRGSLDGADLDGELAAQFELELQEDPTAARLRHFWDLGNALQTGVLFDARPVPDQGARELVALNGICNAHQRISGVLSGQQSETLSEQDSRSQEQGVDFKAIDAIKPATAVLSGSLIAAGTASSAASYVGPVLLGLATTLAASLLLKRSSSSKGVRERKADRTFLPDLSVRTLDRVIPVLVQRLKAAGLAPVFIIDELDKHKRVCEAMEEMIPFLKKLFAEQAFTCFLTDRGYMESLTVTGRSTAYDATSSYFSQRLLVAYEASDYRTYLDRILTGTEDDSTDAAHKGILGWILRHRSRLHALELNRELNDWRGPGGICTRDLDELRSSDAYRCDATLQVAIELRLQDPAVRNWVRQHPESRLLLHDALYYISRLWLDGKTRLDLRSVEPVREALSRRMNIEDARTKGDGKVDPLPEKPLSDSTLDFLVDQVRAMAIWLSESRVNVGTPPIASETVREFLLIPPKASFLMASPENPEDEFIFEYFPSGMPVRERQDLRMQAMKDRRYLHDVHAAVGWLLADTDPQRFANFGSVFELLAEQLHVLPETPAWRPVVDADRQVRLATQGSRGSADLQKGYKAISDYAEMLRRVKPAIQDVLRCAAFLSGFEMDQPFPEAIARSLSLLSAGFGFETVNSSFIQTRMHTMERDLKRHAVAFPAQLDLQFEAGTGSAAMKDAHTHLADLRRAGKELLDQGPWAEIESQAWTHLLNRMSAPEDRSLSATTEEILCHAARRGPALAAPLLTGDTSLTAWMSILLRPHDTKVPAAASLVLRARAMLELGYAAAEEKVRLLLDAWLMADAPASEAEAVRGMLQAAVKSSARSVPSRRPAQRPAILFVRQEVGSAADTWTNQPATAFVMAATPEEANRDLTHAGNDGCSLLQALGSQVVVVFEPPAAAQPPSALEAWSQQKTRGFEDGWTKLLRARNGADVLATLLFGGDS